MKVICYGDSNTHGYDPRSYLGDRYEACWVDILARMTGWDIYNDGRNGRRISKRPPRIPPDTDLLILMLGDNDLLNGLSPGETARLMAAFLRKLPLPKENILLVAPPPMVRGQWVPTQALMDASRDLAAAYRTLADQLGIPFADGGSWNVPMAFDGVHFTQEGHQRFAEGLYAHLREQNRYK